jgi:hypothetical protein
MVLDMTDPPSSVALGNDGYGGAGQVAGQVGDADGNSAGPVRAETAA